MSEPVVEGPGLGRGGRMSAGRKQAAVLRLLRGEDLELVSRELGVTAARLSQWRDAFLAAGEAALKSRPADGRDGEIESVALAGWRRTAGPRCPGQAATPKT